MAIVLMIGLVATPIVDQIHAISVKDTKSKIKSIVTFIKDKLTKKENPGHGGGDGHHRP